MAKQSDRSSTDHAITKNIDWRHFLAQLRTLAAAVWTSRQRNVLLALAIIIVPTIAASAYCQVRLTRWAQEFSDTLARQEDISFHQIKFLLSFASLLVVLDAIRTWLTEASEEHLREALVNDLLDLWLTPMRAFRLSTTGAIGENPDHRIDQDASHLAALTAELGIDFLEAVFLIGGFVGLLWVLSSSIPLSLGGHPFTVPGFMVWVALAFVSVMSLANWRMGRPLIALKDERYAREANFRYSLMRVNDEIDAITLYSGEQDEKFRLSSIFDGVLETASRIARFEVLSSWARHFSERFARAIPILVVAPIYLLTHRITIGQLAAILIAFENIEREMRWLVINYSQYTDWRATLLRVVYFRQTILAMDEVGSSTMRVEISETDQGDILIDDLMIASPDSVIRLSEPCLELKPGERLLVVANENDGRLFFHALSGLWPWGSGRIVHPERRQLMFMPVHAYIPPGVLSAAVAYPNPTDAFEGSAIVGALAAVGLAHLELSLEHEDRWDRKLTDNDKQCVAFARIVLQRPLWVVINEALDVLEPDSRRRITALFASELTDVGLINIGRDFEWTETFFRRRLRLVADPHG